jgi:hypothetical protein
MDKNIDPMIEIFSGALWESGIVKSLLQDAEIESFLTNNIINSFVYEPINAEGIKVMISGSDFERAKKNC